MTQGTEGCYEIKQEKRDFWEGESVCQFGHSRGHLARIKTGAELDLIHDLVNHQLGKTINFSSIMKLSHANLLQIAFIKITKKKITFCLSS